MWVNLQAIDNPSQLNLFAAPQSYAVDAISIDENHLNKINSNVWSMSSKIDGSDFLREKGFNHKFKYFMWSGPPRIVHYFV